MEVEKFMYYEKENATRCIENRKKCIKHNGNMACLSHVL